jgi:hypothetical protein
MKKVHRVASTPTITDNPLGRSQQFLQTYSNFLKKREEKVGFDRAQCGGSWMFIPDPGSDFFPSRIPDPNCLHPASRILIKEFKYFNPKKSKKMDSKL